MSLRIYMQAEKLLWRESSTPRMRVVGARLSMSMTFEYTHIGRPLDISKVDDVFLKFITYLRLDTCK
jgi:hypothetical protein